MRPAPSASAQVSGSLYWTAIGDALGLPYEGLTPRRATRLLGLPTRYRLFFGRGMVSDDTEHALLTAEALARSGEDATAFQRELAALLRGWFWSLPAGIGWATLRACGKLALGFPFQRTGVHSAGNGPMMRSAVIGAAVADLERAAQLTGLSTRLTHLDPKAEYAALAVTVAAWCETHGQKDRYLSCLQSLLPQDEAAHELLALVQEALADDGPPHEFNSPTGVTGYAFHTAPAVLHSWWHFGQDPLGALQGLIECGGDTDTTAAILGGILGASGQPAPAPWLTNLQEPALTRIPNLACRVTDAVQHGHVSRANLGFGPWRWPRNTIFTGIVLAHGFRRMLPPY